MPQALDTQSMLRENLLDAGCDTELMEQLLNLVEQGKKREAITILTQHRKHLLACCHAEQKKIDCLDYLVYTLEKVIKDR